MTNYAYNESTKEKRKPQMSYIKLQRLLHVIVEKYLPCTHEKIGRQRLHPLMFTHVPTLSMAYLSTVFTAMEFHNCFPFPHLAGHSWPHPELTQPTCCHQTHTSGFLAALTGLV